MVFRRGKCVSVRNAADGLLALAALIAVSLFLSTESLAEGLSGYLEYEYTRSDTDLTDAAGESTQTKTDSFRQLYNLRLDRKFYPNLNFLASGIFQKRDDSIDVEGMKRDTTTTNIKPYVGLNLRTPLYFAEAAYGRNEERVRISGSSSLSTVREGIISTLYWKPDRFPDLKIQFSRDHQFDKERRIVDTVTDLYRATSNYRPVDTLLLRYEGTIRDTELRLSDTATKETVHNGRVNYYNNTWWRRRITFGVDYNITKQDVETSTTGAAEVGVRLFPFAGLSASSDTPGSVVLALNPALIDGNPEAGAGVNLGLPPPGGDAKLRNMGMDFLVATEINTLYVLVDQDVAQVADAFSWRIYTSDDDPSDGIQIWIPGQTVSPAIYSPTFNRFEIRFANVTARYVKVVTAPLSPTIPFASAYPTIFVTEIQPEIRIPASKAVGTISSTFQTGNLDFRAVLLEAFNLTYEFNYLFTKRDSGDLFYTVSNGLSFFRQFNKVFSGNGRVAFENGEDQSGSREALVYSASVTAVPFQTLSQSITFSGKEESIAGERTTSNSLLIYNIAKLYEGIDANLSGGISFQEADTGRKNTTTQFNVGATFVPNRKVNLTLLYDGTTTVYSGGGLIGEITTYTRSGEADLSITPVQAVHLFGSYRIEKSTESINRNILNYSLSWSPFPDGTLYLNFSYNETIRTDATKERSMVPNLRWYVTPRSYLNLSYQNLKAETPALTTVSNIYSGTVRISF